MVNEIKLFREVLDLELEVKRHLKNGTSLQIKKALIF